MSLYSLQGAEPAELPFSIVMLEDVYRNGELRYFKGFIRTDPTQFEDWEIEAAGYQAAPDKPSEVPGYKIVWSGDDWMYQAVLAIEAAATGGTLA